MKVDMKVDMKCDDEILKVLDSLIVIVQLSNYTVEVYNRYDSCLVVIDNESVRYSLEFICNCRKELRRLNYLCFKRKSMVWVDWSGYEAYEVADFLKELQLKL